MVTSIQYPPQYGPSTGRDSAVSAASYGSLCDQAMDAYYGGESWLPHLKAHLRKRLGSAPDTKQGAVEVAWQEVHGIDRHDTDAGRVIREEQTELVVLPTVETIVHDLAKLYSADDLRRVYHAGDTEVEGVDKIVSAYHRRGLLPPKLILEDGLVVLLRTSCLRVTWSPALRRIVYDVLPPHWVDILPHPEWPLEVELAQAVVYSESTEVDDEAGGQARNPVWCAYVRPELEGDPEDAITRGWPMGRLVRYMASSPWPLPDPDKDRSAIIEDRANPWVEIGGMAPGRLVWNPIVWHWARPPIEGVHLPPDTSLVRAQLELDVAWSLLMHVGATQCHGQPVMKGAGSPPRALGPSELVRIMDPQGDFFFAAPQAQLQGYLAVIKALFATYALLKKMTPDSWSETRPSIQTGPAKLLEQHGLAEARWERTLMADQWEESRWQRERLLHNAYGVAAGYGPAIPDDVEQTVHWGELRVPVDRAAQVQRIIQELAAKTISRLDAVMETWGIDREAALVKMAEIDAMAPEPPAPPAPPVPPGRPGRAAEPDSDDDDGDQPPTE